MSETNKIILDMINKECSLNQIVNETNLSSKQLFYRLYLLKSKGYEFKKKYYYTGDIVYNLKKGINKNEDNSKIIITSSKDKTFSSVILSDLHITNKGERIDLLNKIYDFCIINGYNIIINAGDVLDGFLGYEEEKKIKDIEKQIEYALKVYPYDKNILNFICFGNHDYNILNQTGKSLESIFDIKRHDLVSLGFGYGELFIKNDKITVIHPKTIKVPKDMDLSTGLIIHGHHHNIKYINDGYSNTINVGSLSEVIKNMPPSFMTINSTFQGGILSKTNIESYLYISDRFIKTSEYECDLSQGKNIVSGCNKNVEDISFNKVLKKQK